MTLDNAAALIVAFCAVAGILVWGLGGKSRQSTNDALSQENQSLRNQLGDCHTESEINRVRAEKSEKNEQYLKDLAQSKPDFGRLADANNNLAAMLATQHKELLASFERLTEGVTNLAKERNNGQ